jgi:hypothetical protein
MDELLEAKVNNIINEINNQLSKEAIDSHTARTLMGSAVNRMLLLMTHVGYLESRLNESVAENQRLNQIARY